MIWELFKGPSWCVWKLRHCFTKLKWLQVEVEHGELIQVVRMFFSKWWFRTIFQIFEYFPDFPLKRVRQTQFTFGWNFWLQMLPKNFLWGLETCLKYVTTSPDLGLSNGTKIVAFGALEKIRHAKLKKRRPHLAFESYFSTWKNSEKS